MASNPTASTLSPAVVAAVTEKQGKALELRKAGMTFSAIGEALGMSEQGAHAAVKAALKRIVTPDGEIVRKLELERIDRVWAKVWRKVIVDNDLTYVPQIERLIRLRADLLGLYAPTKLKVSVSKEKPTLPEIDYSKLSVAELKMLDHLLTALGLGGLPDLSHAKDDDKANAIEADYDDVTNEETEE